MKRKPDLQTSEVETLQSLAGSRLHSGLTDMTPLLDLFSAYRRAEVVNIILDAAQEMARTYHNPVPSRTAARRELGL